MEIMAKSTRNTIKMTDHLCPQRMGAAGQLKFTEGRYSFPIDAIDTTNRNTARSQVH